jgi:hypothetical protein
MKKIKVLLLAIMLTLTAVISAVSTSASSTDLYDDSTYNAQGGYNISLLENSMYEIRMQPINNYQPSDPNSMYMQIQSATLSLEMFTLDDSLNEYLSGNGQYWQELGGGSFSFETTTATDLEISLSTNFGGDETIMYDALAMNYDIQVIWLGNTEPVDNVAPEYTYSNVSVDSPYYDLATVSEIQAQLQAVDDQDGDVSNRIQVYEDQYT